MREIKFRVWYKQSSLMDDEPFELDKDFDCISGCFDRDKIELMQYTGLKDKNGVEIYEGDIVKAHNILHGREYELKHLDCSYALYIDEVVYGWLCFSLVEQLEVIGNIYQNPELFK